MLSKNKSTPAASPAKTGTIIGAGAVLDGNLNAPDMIRVDGTVNGDCTCQQNLVVGQDGRIEGNVKAENVVISGKVNGDITAGGKLELYSTGRVTGNVSAKSLVIDENAYFEGRCTMTAASTESEGSKTSQPPVRNKITESPEEDEAI